MKTIRVGFSRVNKPLSHLIRLCTASQVSHTYIRLAVPEFGEEMIFQASGLQVNYMNAKVFEAHADIVEEYDVEVSDEQWVKAERFRVTEAGKPYSSKQLIGYIWVLLMRNLGRTVRNPLADGYHAHVCVEVSAECIGLHGSESMTQEDLRRWCERNGKLIVKVA